MQPNNSELLSNGDVRSVAPRELIFRFQEDQVIDASTLSAIRVTRSGHDGTFDVASAESDFGTNGQVAIRITARQIGQNLSVAVSQANLGNGAVPTVTRSGSTVSVVLNSNATTPTTAQQLVKALNENPVSNAVLTAQVAGGRATTVLGTINPATYSPIAVRSANDLNVPVGHISVGSSPKQNEVTLRFADNLPDDFYRVQIFGFDDPSSGIIGLRNTSGDLLAPTDSRSRHETIDFRLDLGPQVVAVVPQPVYRVDGNLVQQRDTIVVYFDNDKLVVENDAAGRPSRRSVENVDFYQLILTKETVRNTDDIVFKPVSAKYNALANTVTLKFASDIDILDGTANPSNTWRLRVGTRESMPLAPTASEASATAITDFNTNNAVRMKFTSKILGEAGSGIQVRFINSRAGGAPVVSVAGRVISIDLRSDSATAAQVAQAIARTSSANALVSVSLEGRTTMAIGSQPLSYSPVTLYGLGSSFDTAMDLGIIGSTKVLQTSLILTSNIDPLPFLLDLPGANDDPGHRLIGEEVGGGFEQHINTDFGPDRIPGITTIYYNFKSVYGTDASGRDLVNAITDKQKQRAREALALWSNYLGVQFIETSNRGITIVTGQTSALSSLPGTRVQQEANFGVRIDPSFVNSMLVMSAARAWQDNYGEDWLRNSMAGIGMLLGLEHAGDLPTSTLMRMDAGFLNNGNNGIEPVFPGNQDIIHGQHLFRPDGVDIDLYKFEVDFGGSDRVGLFTAETFAERLDTASSLNTRLELYKQTQAWAVSNLNAGEGLQIRFEAVSPGKLGNQLQVLVTKSDHGDSSGPIVSVSPNLIAIDLNSRVGAESTAQHFINAINNDPAARKLLKATLMSGAPSTIVGNREITYSPISLSGGDVELVAQNDDYFSEDSRIQLYLSSGTYYIGVSASGNDQYDATISDTGFGGRTQGRYDLRIAYRAQVDTFDTIQDIAGSHLGDKSQTLDGNGDGIPGGVHNFWFQTRPLNRVLEFNAGASSSLEAKTIVITGASGVVRRFEFSSDSVVGLGNTIVPFKVNSTRGDLANSLAAAINSRPELGVTAVSNGARVTIVGERTLQLSSGLELIDVYGRTIFVDKAAGPNADGSLSKPFNNIAGIGVINAFSNARPGDIVRIVGNGGVDGNLATTSDNFPYEIGFSLIGGTPLPDGTDMDVPKGVTVMVDAGAVFKMRRSKVSVGSTNLNIDRSGGAIQVLGTPVLIGASGNRMVSNGTAVPGSVYFTSWRDESVGFDNFPPTTIPAQGDWGGILLKRDVDHKAGKVDLEDQGIFLQYINYADIRYGGGGNVLVDSVQQVINPVHIVDYRPTVTYNRITHSADAAMSASPNSFEETNFHEPLYQHNGRFTSDYDRVGPSIYSNSLSNNSLNGLFVRVQTLAGTDPKRLTVPARFNDIDIPHIIAENIIVEGTPGGVLLDDTVPSVDGISSDPAVGGRLVPGTYNYKITFVDRFGYESIPSLASASVTLVAGRTAIAVNGLPRLTGDSLYKRIYRSDNLGGGTYRLVAQLDSDTTSFLDIGNLLGATLRNDRPDVSGLSFVRRASGTLSAGTYNYRVVMIDQVGREGLASLPSTNFVLSSAGSIEVNNLPLTTPGFAGRRIYRSIPGTSGYVLVGELPDSTSQSVTTFTDRGTDLTTRLQPTSLAKLRPRLDASLIVDPGTVVKLEGARIELGFGTHMYAEGTDGLPVIFTSKMDDRYGGGGSFDTNNDRTGTRPQPRDWGGIYASPTSTLSIDHGVIAYGGGVTRIEGTFRAFNPIEVHQASLRLAHSTLEFNADGVGGQGPVQRLGRLTNAPATIFLRGSQPVILNNTLLSNAGSAIDIDVNSMNDDLLGDTGRMTGLAERSKLYDSNHGPLIRGNRMALNAMNGMEIRGTTLTTRSIWDDTDIVHVLFTNVTVENLHHKGGLILQSATDESLVVKFQGYGSNFDTYLGAGLTATGTRTGVVDRVGGRIEILGQPGFPVVLTSFHDDTVGAGFQPDGRPQTDTNGNGIGSIPRPADWRGLLFDQNSHDRNVATIVELEAPNAIAPGLNGTVQNAQFLGELARDASNSDETLRMGFIVRGVIGQVEDVDTYSFTGIAGTEVWLDVDYTALNSDLIIEILNANGALLARSSNSTNESLGISPITTTDLINPNLVNILASRTTGVRRTAAGLIKEDGTTNPRDPGLRVVLPGNLGARNTYYVRVRSASINADNFNAGMTRGRYELQVRMREAQEFAGSTVRFADIRYATNAVHTIGLPSKSPLTGEIQEDENTNSLFNNNSPISGPSGTRPQYVGNLLQSEYGRISIGGRLTFNDVDFYRLDLSNSGLVNSGGTHFSSVVFDLDYADGLNRPDTSLAVYRVLPNDSVQLVYFGQASNIMDDRAAPMTPSDLTDLSRGSIGSNDPFIGNVMLPSGTYLVAVVPANLQPSQFSSAGVLREPIPSVLRIADDFIDGFGGRTAEPPVIPHLLDRSFVGTSISPRNLWHLSTSQAGSGGHRGDQTFAFETFSGGDITQPGGARGELVSNAFDLGNYSAQDLPRFYFNYLHQSTGSDRFDVLVRTAAGTDTLVASNRPGTSTTLTQGSWRQAIVNLGAFAGQNGLRLVFRYDTITTTTNSSAGVHIDNLIIGFAERGEEVLNAFGTGFSTVSVPAGTTLVGEYQLEIRQGDRFFEGNASGGVDLTKTFDTNDRGAQQLTLIAPFGRDVEDGDTFKISDGSTTIVFEFSLDGSVGVGNNIIRYSKNDSDALMATRIRNAINNPSVQSRLKVQAASAGGAVSGSAALGNRVVLIGRASGDFQVYAPQGLVIEQVTSNAQLLRNTILGTGINPTQPATYVGGTGSAAVVNWGGERGILLSTGNVNAGLAPNTNDRSSGVSSGAGDADADAVFGVTTLDSTSLEIKFQFGNGTIGGDLYLDLIFASEEYNEMSGQDVLGVLIDGVNHALVPGSTTPINSATINRTTNPTLFNNNDPNDAGRSLNLFGFDGFTRVLTLNATGLGPGEHTLKIVIADVGSNGIDSAVFIRSSSVGTVPPTRVWRGLEAIYHSGDADQNSNRDQSVFLVENSMFRESRDYAVWSEQRKRIQDPRDVVSGSLAGIIQSRPALTTTGGVVRNLRELNNILRGGFDKGLVVQNNVMDGGGLGGVHIQGENPIWMISPAFIPATDGSSDVNTEGTHFGWYIDDGDVMVIDAGRKRVRFEFEDIAGGSTADPHYGSGVVGGNGHNPDRIPVYYREDTGGFYLRIPGDPPTPFGSTALEASHSLRDSILASILVTNGTSDIIIPTVAPSLLPPTGNVANSTGYPNTFDRPAVFLEGPTAITWIPRIGGNPWTIQMINNADTVQPFGRVVNNTIFGKDGRASFDADRTAAEPNDTIATAIETWQGTALNPIGYTVNGTIGDFAQFRAPTSTDVDIYQFKLNVGDRLIIDVDTVPGTLNSVLQIFDVNGRLVTSNSAGAAPGEVLGEDPYLDFTATTPGVYFAALSGIGNTDYDPLSLANRKPSTSQGDYTMSMTVYQPHDFVLTVRDLAAYPEGSTFTIAQVGDLPGAGTNEVTFEFTYGAPVAPGNIPIPLMDEYRVSDIARAIASAINSGRGGGPALPNQQSLPNGPFGTANPLNPVRAVPLGGRSGMESGLQNRGTAGVTIPVFPQRLDGLLPTHSSLGMGHDRLMSTAITNTTSAGDGTTEKFVKISNAAYIRGNGTVLVDPDFNDNHNLNQIIPETGIFVSRGASPSLVNNVIVNVQTPIVLEETRRLPNGLPAPFGSGNANVHPKPGEVIVGGNTYQYVERAQARNRLGEGIETGPTNVPNTGLDFNTELPAGVKIFVEPQAGQFFPRPGSLLIDSSIDSLPEREAFKTIKQAMGISVSPVLAPSIDLVGLLRVDDPTVAPPNGLGADVFKDRGALDRSDFVGPSAVLVNPIDNDAQGNDRDASGSFVQLTSGSYSEFRIQLRDGFGVADPFPGIGVDDNSVVGARIDGLRLPGSAVSILDNGKLLIEGVDYKFQYNPNNNEIVLTPLAGVWKNDRVYEISINNRDRFVLKAPSGAQIQDGDRFTINDLDGGIVHFEFDSGYKLQLPQGLTIDIPLAGGGIGGIADGDRFTINDGTRTATFEFDRDGRVLTGNIAIAFDGNTTQGQLATRIRDAIRTSPVSVNPIILSGNRVFLGGAAGIRVNTMFSNLSQPNPTLALLIPPQGARPGGIVDGQTFRLNDGLRTIVFEYDTDGLFVPGNFAINTAQASTPLDVAQLTRSAILASGLVLNPTVVGSDVLHLGLPTAGFVDVSGSRLSVVGVSRTLIDGASIRISYQGTTRVFEFSTDAVVAPGSIRIPFTVNDTQDQIALRLVNAIRAADLALSPELLEDGSISIGGTPDHLIVVDQAVGVSLFGQPGFTSSSTLAIVGSIVLRVPARGGLDVVDNSTFSITANGNTVVFEFDNNFSGPSQPGNRIIGFTSLSTANEIATAMAVTISNAGLGINATNIGGGRVDLGLINDDQVDLMTSGLTKENGNVTDGENFTISNGVVTLTFEYENTSSGNGFARGNIPILFDNASSRLDVANATLSTILGSGLGFGGTVLADGRVRLDDTPRTTISIANAPSLRLTGVPGGATPIQFLQSTSFTPEDVARSMVKAINAARNTSLSSTYRGGDTVFVEGAAFVDHNLTNFMLQGVRDIAGNFLVPNRINGETQFTILMPGVGLDFGDAPDPFSTTSGRYPTRFLNDGARHVVIAETAHLGSTVSVDLDGRPTPAADGDAADDGVTFTSARNPNGVFNKHAFTDITVNVSAPGFVDAWVDFNADGDWDDPGEKIINSVEFVAGTQTFSVRVPSSAPNFTSPTTTYARFRVSPNGGLLPTGLAVGGEVEDYRVLIIPGRPPVAVNDRYEVMEDAIPGLVTTDPNGSATPGFTSDDGLVANDVDADADSLSVVLVEGPTHAAVFNLNANGTFTYQPNADFFGVDRFTYKVFDGHLLSANIATVTISVKEKNDAPVVANDQLTISEDEDTLIDRAVLLANDRSGPANENTQTLTIIRVQSPSARGGRVALEGGNVRYTPPTDFSGTDTFTYTVRDNGTTNGLPDPLEATATVTITVLDKNDPPITGIDRVTVVEDQTLVVDASDLLSNDRPGPANESSQTLTLVGVESNSDRGGTVTFANGRVTYIPKADFTGTDQFYYLVRDNGLSGGASDPQTSRGTVVVTVTPVNDAPRILAPLGTRTVVEDAADTLIDLRTIFVDPDVETDGDRLTYTVVGNTNPNLVQTIINGNNLRLILQPDQNGQAQITVQASDLAGATRRDTLTLNVTPVEDTPRLVTPLPDLDVNEDAPRRTIRLTPNHFVDPDVSTNNDALTFSVVTNTNPDLVTAAIAGDSLTLDFAADKFGFASITIRATDRVGNSITDSFDITVNEVNDAPRTLADNFTVRQGSVLRATDVTGNATVEPNDNGVLANDVDVEGDVMTARVVRGPNNGSLTFNADGSFVYTPRGLQGSTDTFTYEVVDARGAVSVETTVTIRVTDPIPSSHRNPLLAEDVNADGFVSPIDALLVINFLNKNGASTPISSLPAPPPYLDTDGNYLITPRDALLVINFLNANRRGGGGEGEGTESVGVDQFGAAGLVWSTAVCRPLDNFSTSMQPVAPISVESFEVFGPMPSPEVIGPSDLEHALELDDLVAGLEEDVDAQKDGQLTDLVIADWLGGDLT